MFDNGGVSRAYAFSTIAKGTGFRTWFFAPTPPGNVLEEAVYTADRVRTADETIVTPLAFDHLSWGV